MDIIDLLSEIQKASGKSVTLHAFFVDGVISGWVAGPRKLQRFSGWSELRGIVDALCDESMGVSVEREIENV